MIVIFFYHILNINNVYIIITTFSKDVGRFFVKKKTTQMRF